jgi:hypothetical protein
MRQTVPLLALAVLLPAPLAHAQMSPRDAKVHADKKAFEARGDWIYNDLPRAFAEAKKSGKPILAVLRCIPCEECVKLDDDLIDADRRVKPLLEKFVRVRVVMTNSLDLSVFQMDYDQSFAAFLLNADGTVYGRFGTRSHRKEWVGDVSVEGLANALQGALELHAAYPKNREELALKKGPAPAFPTPEQFPTLKGRYKATLDYEGKVTPSCIHCHQVGEAIREHAMKGRKLTDDLLFPYPHPRVVGLTLDPKARARVLKVEEGSAAAEAGFKAEDVITRLGGQPLLSIADVQWVLHRASGEGAEIKAEVKRGGKAETRTLKLPAGWKRKDDISWRASTWELRRLALGGMLLQAPEGGKELVVQHVGQYAPHDIAHRAGVRRGDVFVRFDGKELQRETDLIAYSLLERKENKVALEMTRGGKPYKVTLTLP